MSVCVLGSDYDLEPLSLQDELLLQVIRERIGSRVRRLRIIRSPHGFILEGHSSTFYGKQLAQHALMDVTEVPIYANNIEVV